MSLSSFLNLSGTVQGAVQGSVTQSGREDSIEVLSVKHLVHFPLDAVTGLPTTNKSHKPITITKEVDKSSPILFTMLTNSESVSVFKLDFWRPSNTGAEEHYYTIELTNARIVSIRLEQKDLLDPVNQSYPVIEQITFTYESIILTFEDGGIAATDNWTTTS